MENEESAVKKRSAEREKILKAEELLEYQKREENARRAARSAMVEAEHREEAFQILIGEVVYDFVNGFVVYAELFDVRKGHLFMSRKSEIEPRSTVEAIRRTREESRRVEDMRIEEERRRHRDASERRKRDEEEAVTRQLSAIKDIGDRAKELSQMVKEKVEGEANAAAKARDGGSRGRAWRNPYSTSLTHLPPRSFGTVATAPYADRPEQQQKAEVDDDSGGAAKTPDEVLQSKNQEENRRKSQYKYARLGAESGRKTEVRISRSQFLHLISLSHFHSIPKLRPAKKVHTGVR